MESHSLLPSNNIKLELACETDNVQSSAGKIISEDQVFEKMDSKMPASVKIEQAEVYVDYADESMKSMESRSLLPSKKIKLEPACEIDNVQSSTGEVISKDQVFDKMSSKIPASVKIEQTDVYVDYPDESLKICFLRQEQTQMDKKMVFGNIDRTLVKHGRPDVLCGGKSHRSSKLLDMAGCGSIQEMEGHDNGESRMLEDVTLVNHREVPLTVTENDYPTSHQQKQYSHSPKRVSSVIDINTKLDLTNENCQHHHAEAPVKHTEISGTSLDCTSCSPQRIEAGDLPHMSDVCNVTVSEDPVLHSHKTTDAGEKPYKCEICSSSFAIVSSLKRHMRAHTGERPYKCDICGSSFTYSTDLNYHVRIHTGEKPYKCDFCGASFTHSSHLKHHLRTHTGEKPYKCDICSSSFAAAKSLKSHMGNHTGEKPYKCDICSASFTQSGNLKCHIRTHTGEKPYKCDICGAFFTSTGGLKYHVRIHTDEKPYKCDVCSASFSSTGHLKYHVRTHTGEKPYKCDICSASFTSTSGLKYHVRTHTGEKPYKCDICAVSFAAAGSLKSHMGTHTGEKPYKCNICNAAFTQTSNLKCHMKTHTREKP